MADEVNIATKATEKKVSLASRSLIRATAKAKHMVEGKEYLVHPCIADVLKAKGYATIVKKDALASDEVI